MIHVGPEHFKILNWLPVTKRVYQIILCHVFKIKSGTAPDYLGEYFSLASLVHGCFTRFWNNGSYTIPKVKEFGKKSFAYKGGVLWNDLPLYIRQINGLLEFKDAVKNYLLLQWIVNVIYWLSDTGFILFVWILVKQDLIYINHFINFSIKYLKH